MHAITLRIRVSDDRGLSWIAESLGECARDLEAHEAEGNDIGLVPDPDDPGRYGWEIVSESYT